MNEIVSDDLLREHDAFTNGVGVADASDRTRLEVTGVDRAAFLHSFCTNDVKRLLPGTGCEAFVTNHQGKTIGYVYVLCQADSLLLCTSAGQASALVEHFNRFVISERIEFIDRSETTSELLVAGANSAGLLTTLTGVEPPTDLLSHATLTIAGQSALVCRSDFAGPASFFIQIPRDGATAVKQALIVGGAIECSPAAVEMARIEAGTPLFGSDITEANLPQEVGRDARAISFKKGCYLGQETVARLDALGHVNRLLASVRFSGDSIPPPGTEIFAGEKLVGQVTSSAFSPRHAAPLALAYLRRLSATPGTELKWASGTAKVVSR